jgi:hypothetical protein
LESERKILQKVFWQSSKYKKKTRGGIFPLGIKIFNGELLPGDPLGAAS